VVLPQSGSCFDEQCLIMVIHHLVTGEMGKFLGILAIYACYCTYYSTIMFCHPLSRGYFSFQLSLYSNQETVYNHVIVNTTTFAPQSIYRPITSSGDLSIKLATSLHAGKLGLLNPKVLDLIEALSSFHPSPFVDPPLPSSGLPHSNSTPRPRDSASHKQIRPSCKPTP
jgi:hypothetical protein